MNIATRIRQIADAVEIEIAQHVTNVHVEHDLHAGSYAYVVDAEPIAFLHAAEGPITLSIVDAEGDVVDEIIDPTAQQIIDALISER